MLASWIKKPNVIVCIALAVVVLAAYAQVYDFELTTRDDNTYVTDNPPVQEGLNWKTLRWAFATNHEANWYPLSWASLMLDTDIGRFLDTAGIGFGNNNSGLFHLTNVWLHILATILLFLVLNRATGMRWPSAIVAALFAIHPMHVESVAWVSERKDVLSAVFWMLTMWAYLCYVEKPRAWRYAVVVLVFALGLMSKSILMTLPLALLLVDVWPLRRLDFTQPRCELISRLKSLVVEKWALFGLAGAAGIFAVWAAKTGGAVTSVHNVSAGVRLANAVVSYVEYVILTFWPVGLGTIYPHPGNAIAAWKIVVCLVILVFVTVMVVRNARQRPWVFAGWLWFGVTLLPVIGILQIGGVAMADRFAYIPHIGLFAVLVYWPFCSRKAVSRRPAVVLAIVWGAALLALWIGTYKQIGHWRNSETLYARAIAVTPRNPIAHNGLGALLAQESDFEQAEYHFRMAVKQEPEFIEARVNLASALGKLGRYREAEAAFRRAIHDDPKCALARNNLGALYYIEGKLPQAIREWRGTLKYYPRDAEALGYLSQVGAGPDD